MPSWLISLLIKLAISVGLPFLMEKLTWVPASVWEFIAEALKHIKTSDDKPEALRQVNAKLKECAGSFCAVDTKKV